MSAAGEALDLAQEQDFQQVLNICSSDAFDGLDYMSVDFHRWLQEPGRITFIVANNRVVALASALLVDGGQTAVLQGLRVVRDLRGRGIGDALQKYVTDYVRHHYPQICAVLNICSSLDFGGLDYMPVSFHRWLQEPGRVTFIARIDSRVVALASALLVDGGQTAVLQGLRVVRDLRGRGIGDALQKYVTDYVRHHYPQVCAVRFSRAVQPSPQTLARYRLVAKEAVVSLRCEAVHLSAFVAELRSRLRSPGAVTLSQQQAETLVLSHHVVSSLLPSQTIISDWEPLRPVEANMEVLRRRRLTWIVDREPEPSAVSLCTSPHAVPCRHDALHFKMNVFGRSVASVCAVFVAQLETLLPRLQGLLIFHTFVHPEVWAGLHQFCQNNASVSFFKDYWEEVILEGDL